MTDRPKPHPADDPAMRGAVFAGTAADPAWLGHWLERRRRRTGAGREAVAADLKTDLRGLTMLALCRTPTEENFADDLEAVCRRTGADPTALARLLRAEQRAAAWTAGPESSSAAPPAGWLMAASEAGETDDSGGDGDAEPRP